MPTLVDYAKHLAKGTVQELSDYTYSNINPNNA